MGHFSCFETKFQRERERQSNSKGEREKSEDVWEREVEGESTGQHALIRATYVRVGNINKPC